MSCSRLLVRYQVSEFYHADVEREGGKHSSGLLHARVIGKNDAIVFSSSHSYIQQMI